MTHILFICSKNQWRSPTAERVFKDYPNIYTRSAGTSRQARHAVSSRDILWADMIFVMEYQHKDYLKQHFRDAMRAKKVIVLDIPDDYQYMDADLIDLLKLSVEPHLSNADIL